MMDHSWSNVSDAIADLKVVIDIGDEHSISRTISNVLDGLTCRDQSCSTTTSLKSLASFLSASSSRYPFIKDIVLSNLNSFHDPLPFIEIIPTLFASASIEMIIDVIKQLESLLSKNKSLLLPILTVWMELSVFVSSTPLLNLIYDSMSYINEADLPFLARALLLNYHSSNFEYVTIELLGRVRKLSENTIVLVIESLWEILPTNPVVQKLMISYFEQLFVDKSSGVYLLDVAMMAILTAFPSQDPGFLSRLYWSWLHSEAVSLIFRFLSHILTIRRSNEVWERMVQPIWALMCTYLPLLAQSSRVTTSHSARKSPATGGVTSNLLLAPVSTGVLRNEVMALVSQIFEQIPILQESIIMKLLSLIFASSPHPRYSAALSTNRHQNTGTFNRSNRQFFPSYPYVTAIRVPKFHSKTVSKSSSRHSLLYCLDIPKVRTSQYLVNVLQDSTMADENSDPAPKNHGSSHSRPSPPLLTVTDESISQFQQRVITARTASAILQKIMSGSSSSASDHTGNGLPLLALTSRLSPDHRGLLHLPPPAVLHCFITSLTVASVSAPSLEATLFILLQKLLSVAQARSSSFSSLSSQFFRQNRLQPSSMPLLSNRICDYSEVQLGFILAIHMYFRKTDQGVSSSCRMVPGQPMRSHSGNTLSSNDSKAILKCVNRSIKNLKLSEIPEALDFILAVATVEHSRNNSEEVVTSRNPPSKDSNSGYIDVIDIIRLSFDRLLEQDDPQICSVEAYDSTSLAEITALNYFQEKKTSKRKRNHQKLARILVGYSFNSLNSGSSHSTQSSHEETQNTLVWRVESFVQRRIISRIFHTFESEVDFESILEGIYEIIQTFWSLHFYSKLLRRYGLLVTPEGSDDLTQIQMTDCNTSRTRIEIEVTRHAVYRDGAEGDDTPSSNPLSLSNGRPEAFGQCYFHPFLKRLGNAESGSGYNSDADSGQMTMQDIIRFAWEHALTASILLGTVGDENDWMNPITHQISESIGEILHVIYLSRKYIRLATKQLNENKFKKAKSSKTSKKIVGNKSSDSKSKKSRIIIGNSVPQQIHKPAAIESRTNHEDTTAPFTSKSILEEMLRHMDTLLLQLLQLIPKEILNHFMKEILDTATAVAKPIKTRHSVHELKNMSSEVTNLFYPLLFTKLGSILIETSFIHYCQSPFLSNASNVSNQIASLDFVISYQSIGFGVSNDVVSIGSDADFIENIEKVFASIPLMMSTAESLRKRIDLLFNLQENQNRVHDIYGPNVTYEKCNYLVVLSIFNLHLKVSSLSSLLRPNNNDNENSIENYLSNKYFRTLAEEMVKNHTNKSHMSSDLDISTIYNSIERELLRTQDLSVSIASLHLLWTLTKEGFFIRHRLRSLCWTLVTSLMTSVSIDKIVTTRLSFVGLSPFQSYLLDYIFTIPLLSPAIEEKMKRNVAEYKACYKILFEALRPKDLSRTKHADHEKSHGKFHQIRIFEVSRILWGYWWLLEDQNNRIYGISNLLKEVFLHLSNDDASRPTSTKLDFSGLISLRKAEDNFPDDTSRGNNGVSPSFKLSRGKRQATSSLSKLDSTEKFPVPFDSPDTKGNHQRDNIARSNSDKTANQAVKLGDRSHGSHENKRKRILYDSDDDEIDSETTTGPTKHGFDYNSARKKLNNIQTQKKKQIYSLSHTAYSKKNELVFSSLNDSNCEDYLLLAFALFPTVIIEMKPRIPTQLREHNKTPLGIHSRPYSSYIHACQLIMWANERICQLTEGDSSRLIFLSIFWSKILFRSLRSIIFSMEVYILDAVRWRSRQMLPQESNDSTSKDASNQQHKSPIMVSPEEMDWGKLSFFEEILNLSKSTQYSILRLCTTLKRQLVGFNNSPKLSNSSKTNFNTLQTYASRFSSKLDKLAAGHKITLRPISDNLTTADLLINCEMTAAHSVWGCTHSYHLMYDTEISGHEMTLRDWLNQQNSECIKVTSLSGKEYVENVHHHEGHHRSAAEPISSGFTVRSRIGNGWGLYTVPAQKPFDEEQSDDGCDSDGQEIGSQSGKRAYNSNSEKSEYSTESENGSLAESRIASDSSSMSVYDSE